MAGSGAKFIVVNMFSVTVRTNPSRVICVPIGKKPISKVPSSNTENVTGLVFNVILLMVCIFLVWFGLFGILTLLRSDL